MEIWDARIRDVGGSFRTSNIELPVSNEVPRGIDAAKDVVVRRSPMVFHWTNPAFTYGLNSTLRELASVQCPVGFLSSEPRTTDGVESTTSRWIVASESRHTAQDA